MKERSFIVIETVGRFFFVRELRGQIGSVLGQWIHRPSTNNNDENDQKNTTKPTR